jgi:hypothetical protein
MVGVVGSSPIAPTNFFAQPVEAMKIVIGSPSYDGSVHREYMRSVMALADFFRESGIDWRMRLETGTLRHITLNVMASDALLDEANSHILFVGTDAGFELATVQALIAAGREVAVSRGVALVSVGALRRLSPHVARYRYTLPFDWFRYDHYFGFFDGEVVDGRQLAEEESFYLRWTRDCGGAVHAIGD